jgi:hypothetical protein
VWNDEDEPEDKSTLGDDSAPHVDNADIPNRTIHNGTSGHAPGASSWDGNAYTLGMNGYNTNEDPAISSSNINDSHNIKSSGDMILGENDATQQQSLQPFASSGSASTSCSTQAGNTRFSLSAEMTAAISETASIQDEDRSATTRSSGSSSRTPNSSNRTSSSLHPLAISSSASCPQPNHSNALLPSRSPTGTFSSSSSLMQPPSSSADLYSVDLSQALERSNLGYMAVASPPPVSGQAGEAPSNPHLAMLANNFLMATTGAMPSSQSSTVTASASYQSPNVNGVSTHSVASQFYPQQQGAVQVVSGTSKPPPQQSSSVPSNSSSASNNTTSSSVPPFYLFDAPVELRANFMQNQRRLGLPVERDPNSFHYGEMVNGYHPQQFQNAGAMTGLDSNQINAVVGLHHRTSSHHPSHHNPPKMIDARHGGNSSRRNRSGQIKNEREQKRAQKITELIEQLRVQIENDGWQVEGRSKFNTLSK